MRVRQTVSINAPVEQAFAYLDRPENSLALIPSLVEVKRSKQLRSLLSVVKGRIEAGEGATA